MGTKTNVEIYDDLDGLTIDNGGSFQPTIFGWDGVSYSIDLSEKNRAKLEKALQPFLENAKRVSASSTRRSGATKTSGGNSDLYTKVREGAAKEGIEVSQRGRIKQEIIDAYNSTQK